jgi:uncharacterized protein (DUF433 family)
MRTEERVGGEGRLEQGIVADGATGEAIIAGIDVPVAIVLERLLLSESVEGVLGAFPGLTRQGFDAAVRYSAASVRGHSFDTVSDLGDTFHDDRDAYDQARHEFERTTRVRDGFHDLAAVRLTPHAEVIAELRAMLPA